MSNQLVAEATTYITSTRDQHPFPQQYWNPQPQQLSKFRPMP